MSEHQEPQVQPVQNQKEQKKEESYVYQFFSLGGIFIVVLGIGAVSIGTIYAVHMITEMVKMIFQNNFDYQNYNFERVVWGVLLIFSGFIANYIGIKLSSMTLINWLESVMRLPVTIKSENTTVTNLSLVVIELIIKLLKNVGLLLITLQFNTLMNVLSDAYIVYQTAIFSRNFENIKLGYDYSLNQIGFDFGILLTGFIIRRVATRVESWLAKK